MFSNVAKILYLVNWTWLAVPYSRIPLWCPLFLILTIICQKIKKAHSIPCLHLSSFSFVCCKCSVLQQSKQVRVLVPPSPLHHKLYCQPRQTGSSMACKCSIKYSTDHNIRIETLSLKTAVGGWSPSRLSQPPGMEYIVNTFTPIQFIRTSGKYLKQSSHFMALALGLTWLEITYPSGENTHLLKTLDHQEVSKQDSCFSRPPIL